MLQICIRSSCLCPSSAQSLRASSCHGGVSLTRTLVLPRRAFSASCAVQSGKTTILREHVYGRTRIYTSTMGKIKSSTTTKTCIAAPVTSPRLTWEWLHTAPGSSASPHEQRPSSPSLSIISSVKQNLRELFLPVGYPDNLHPCYKKFHLWLALETYVGSCIGVLCSQAMLASLGLGTVEATSGAVIKYILKDGIGEVGKLFFIKRYASSFDSHPKTWKFVCEILSSVGSFLQLCTSIASPKLFLPLASVGNAFELVHESVWIASHMTFTKQFSPNGNIGDIVAKDDAQMSTAHLLGMLSGVGLIAVCDSPAFLFTMFAILSPINIWSTYKMIQASKFEILNQAKATLLTRAFIDMGHVQTYDELAPKEIGFGEWIKPGKGNIRFKIHMGASADEAFRCAEEVSNATTILGAEQYLLNFDGGKNTMAILYHDDAAPRDILKSILHANKMHDHLDAQKINKDTHWDAYWQAMADSRDWTNANLDAFVQSLDDYKWQRETVYWNDTGKRVTWDRA